MPSSDDHRAWGSEAAIHFKLHSTLCMWNTNLGVAVVLQGRWLGMKSRWAGMPICVSQRKRVYLHLCLTTSSYELRDAQPWDQRGPRVIPSKHHHYVNSLSRPKGPESWRAKITWPNKKIPFLASTVHHGICRVLHTYPRYGGYALCIHCLGRKSDPEWPSHDVASGEGKKKSFCHIAIRTIQSRVWRPPQPKGHFCLVQPEDTAFCTPTGSRLKEAVGED